MKTKILLIGMMCALTAGSAGLINADSFSYLRTHRQGREAVAATWAASSTPGVTHFILQRTYEFPDEFTVWDNIYEANALSQPAFKYTDRNVFPGTISYRVVAMNGTSPVFISEISEVRIRQH